MTGVLTAFEQAVLTLGAQTAAQVRDRAAASLAEQPLSPAQVDLLAGLMARTPAPVDTSAAA